MIHVAPVVLPLDNSIQRTIRFDSIYPLQSDLLGGLGYSTFEGGSQRLILQ